MPKPKQSDMDVDLNALRGRRPSRTTEGRFKEIGIAALNLIERRILDGTASAAETVMMANEISRMRDVDLDYKRAQTMAHQAKAEAILSAQRSEEMYMQAIQAMQRYGGEAGPEEDVRFYGM